MSTIYNFHESEEALGAVPAADDEVLVFDTSTGKTKNATVEEMAAAPVAVTEVTTDASSITNHGITTLAATAASTYDLGAPVAGLRKVLTQTVTTTAAQTVRASTGGAVTFDGSNHLAAFNADKETLEIVGLSATRWAIVANTGSVALSAS